jgi:MSHA biogenesis protein MshE
VDKGPVSQMERAASRAERPEKIRLGELLLAMRLITPDQLKVVLEQHLRSGKKVGKLFVDAGHINEDQLGQAVAQLYRAKFVDLKSVELVPDVVKRLTEAQARHHKVIVLEDHRTSYLVGFADPSDLVATDEVARLLKREVQIAVVGEQALAATLDRVYRKADQASGIAKELEQDIGDSYGGNFASAGSTDDSAVARLVTTIFDDAIRLGASDVHIEPQEHKLVVRFRVDGILQAAMEAEPKIAPAVLSRLKILSGLNISEKRLPQDGRFALTIRDSVIDTRLSTLPCQFGESAVMRILSTGAGPRKLDKIGMPEELLARFRAATQRSSGLILVTGPTGSGKTTTLYSALSELNTVDTKIITAEDPVEYRLPGIIQVQINDKIEFTFGAVLRSVLRQDPDVILVGEMRDSETASIGLRAAITGHLVFSTLHTRDAAGTPVRLLDMGVPPVMVASALQAVVAQRLVRTNCESCAVPYQPAPQELAWLRGELDEPTGQARYLKGKGCPKCGGSGFRGRVGIYELLELNQALVAFILRGDTEGFQKAAREQMRGRNMQCNGLHQAMAGRTTIAEVMRVASSVGE